MTNVYKLGGFVPEIPGNIERAINFVREEPGCKAIVISAKAGITDYLRYDVASGKVSPEDAKDYLREKHLRLASRIGIPESSVKQGLEEALLGIDSNNPEEQEAVGERLMLGIYESYLNMQGIPTKGITSYDLGIKIRDNLVVRDPLMNVNIRKRLEEFFDEGLVPLVTGYDGVSDGGEVSVLKRSGSDQTATFLAHLLNAQAVYLLKDQRGVETAKPELFPGKTRNVPMLSYDMAMESGNIQMEAIRFVRERDPQIPLIIPYLRDSKIRTVINGSFTSNGIELVTGEEKCAFFEVRDIRDRPGAEEEILSLFKKYGINKLRGFGETGHSVSYVLNSNLNNLDDVASELEGHRVANHPCSLINVIGNINRDTARRFEDTVYEVCEPLTPVLWTKGVISSIAVPREDYEKAIGHVHETLIEKH
jgi:aspartate kinase